MFEIGNDDQLLGIDSDYYVMLTEKNAFSRKKREIHIKIAFSLQLLVKR